MACAKPLDPDTTRRDDAPYWAAAVVLAIRNRDADREQVARTQLDRLGFRITPTHNNEVRLAK